jgi:hypothetical protein
MPMNEVVQGDLFLRWTPIVGPQELLDVPTAPAARHQPELRGAHQTDPLLRALLEDRVASQEFDIAIDESAGKGQSVGWHGSECVSPTPEEQLPQVPDRTYVRCRVPKRPEKPKVVHADMVGISGEEKPAAKETPKRRTPREIFCDRPPATPQAQQFCSEAAR